MTPRTVFTLALKIIGIWKIAYGIEDFTTAWNLSEGFFKNPYDTATSFVNLGVIHILLGIALLFGASAISALLFPLGKISSNSEA